MSRRKKKEPLPYLYMYKETRHSGRGIAALVLSILSLAALAVLTGISVYANDLAGSWMGVAGFAAFSLAFIGMVQGLFSFRDNCRSYFFSRIGTLISGFMVGAWFILFCVGLAAGG